LPPRPPGVCAAAPCAPGKASSSSAACAAGSAALSNRITSRWMRKLIADTSLVGPRIVNDTGFLYTIPEENVMSGPVSLQSPTPSPSDVAAGIAAQFTSARLAARSLREYPGAVPADLETAYRCQDLALARWPDAVAGWKVARIAQAQQGQYAEERLI